MGGACMAWQVEQYKGQPNIRLIGLMKDKGFSDEKLSKVCGVSEKTIQAIRLGKYWPRLDSVLLICKALNCTIDTLYPLNL